ncbi:MAG TPA: alpha/beta hydrolase [Pseudonocardia sp.]
MPLHPQVQAHLERLAAVNFADLHTFTPERARLGMGRMAAQLPAGESVRHVDDRSLPTDAGDVAVRIYRPSDDEALPVTVFFHGGGFVLGDLDTHDGLARALANASNSVVISVDYPLAPEHRYPAAPDAAYGATRWVAEHGPELDVDGARLAVAGDSAGGNLAAVVALRARDEGGPDVALQLLIYPDLDFRRSNFSVQEFAGRYGNISRPTQFWFMDNYLSSPDERLLPLVSPLLAPELAGLPTALIITAEYDALRDEGEQYGARLEQAGVPVTVSRYDGMIHEFLRQPFDDSRKAIAEAGAAMREAFASVGPISEVRRSQAADVSLR